MRIEHVVAGVARQGAGERRQPDLREDAVDGRLLLLVELLVEGAGRAERVAARHADRRRQPPQHVGVHAFAREIEAGANALLDRGGEDHVARPERPRLPERADHAVLGEAKAAAVLGRVVGGIAGAQADARVEVDRAVAAADVAPADVEEAARRELELLRAPRRPARSPAAAGWPRRRRRSRSSSSAPRRR